MSYSKNLPYFGKVVESASESQRMTELETNRLFLRGAMITAALGTILTAAILVAPFLVVSFELPLSIYVSFLVALPFEILFLRDWIRSSHADNTNSTERSAQHLRKVFRVPH